VNSFNFEPLALPAQTAGLRREVREFLREELADMTPRERAHTWQGFDAGFSRKLGEKGWIGMTWPREYGGQERSVLERYVLLEELLAAGAPVAAHWIADRQSGTLLLRFGREDVRRRYLPAMARGELFCCIGMSEPNSGSDLASIRTRATRVDGGWKVNGSKLWTTNADKAHLMIALVRTSEGPTLFLLELDEVRPHLEIRPIELIANRHTTTLFIDGLRVPDSARLGPVGGGLRCLMDGFPLRRVLAAAESLGNARFFLERSIEHARTRSTFGRLIGQNQGVQYPIAQVYGRIEAADLMRWDAVRLIEQGAEAGGRSALAKILASEAAWEAGRVALTTFGGWGLAGEYHVERKLRDAAVFVFNNMLLSYVAERVLGLPKAF